MYLTLVDLGMSASVARLLVDHKDERGSGAYGGLIQTGWLVLVVQGAFIFMTGAVIAPWLSRLLRIPAGLEQDFIALMRWQSATLALGFTTRIFSHLLNAHQRLDLYNYSQIANLFLQFGWLWWFFHAGQGVFSLAWSALAGTLGGAGGCFAACWRLRVFPSAGAWGRPSWRCFREVFSYGTDMFLVAVGTQLIMASQTMIITRCLGLEAAAVWNVGTRAYNLVSQALWRVFDSSGPALSEMIVRGERVWLRERFKNLVILSAAMSGVAAVVFALCNSTFVSLYTHGKMYWSPGNDLLLGVWMVVMTILHCHNSFVLLTKKIEHMRYVYFVEGMVFVLAALLVARWGGLLAVISCSIICSTALSGAYGVWRMSRYFGFPLAAVGVRWQEPLVRILCWFAPVALAWWWAWERTMPYLVEALTGSTLSERGPLFTAQVVRLAATALFAGPLGGYLFLRLGLPASLQRELLSRVSPRISPLLRRVFSLRPG